MVANKTVDIFGFHFSVVLLQKLNVFHKADQDCIRIVFVLRELTENGSSLYTSLCFIADDNVRKVRQVCEFFEIACTW